MPVTHKFVSAKADGGDATLVRPSNWNDDHDGPIILEGTIVQQVPSTNSATSPKTITLSAAPTVGNTIYCVTIGSTNAAITPTQTNVAWAIDLDSTNGTTARATLWKGTISASAGTAITLTRASGSAFFAAWAIELSGISGTLAASATATATTAGYDTDAIMPAAAHFLITAGVAASGGTGNWRSGMFLNAFSSNYFFIGYRPGHMDNFPIGGHASGTTALVTASFIAAIT
jgi:hypothetical protein